MNVRRWLLGSSAALGLVGIAPVVAPAAPIKPVTTVSCKKAIIGGQRKCIARGQYCAARYASQYRHYGLSCSKRDVNGRYHLR